MTRDEQAVQRIQAQLAQLGPVLPGSLSEQWNVCGTPGCRCKAPSNPKKHGPYYQLSFTVAGQSSTLFIQKGDLGKVRRRLRRYRESSSGLSFLQSGPTSPGKPARTNRVSQARDETRPRGKIAPSVFPSNLSKLER